MLMPFCCSRVRPSNLQSTDIKGNFTHANTAGLLCLLSQESSVQNTAKIMFFFFKYSVYYTKVQPFFLPVASPFRFSSDVDISLISLMLRATFEPLQPWHSFFNSWIDSGDLSIKTKCDPADSETSSTQDKSNGNTRWISCRSSERFCTSN